MKEQYAGDVNDYAKYALLRGLAADGRVRIGVCWMLTPPDGGSDGRKTGYLEQPERWRAHAPDIYDRLLDIMNKTGAGRLRRIEAAALIPNGSYFNERLTDDLPRRRSFFDRAHRAFSDRHLIFYDPDNGLEVASRPKGKKASSKFLYYDEVEATYARGHSVLIYQHFRREERTRTIRNAGERLSGLCPKSTLHAFRTPHVVFLLVTHPSHESTLAPAADVVAGQGHAAFIRGQRLALATPQP